MPPFATNACDSGLHDRFLELLPRIETHGKIYFRHKKGEEKAEAMQEMRALAWKWFVRENQNGKDPATFMFNFTRFLVLAVNAGRGVVRMQKTKDVLSPRCQREKGFRVESLPSSTAASHETLYGVVRGQHEHDAMEELLRDNTQTPVVEQVIFRLDWPAWLKTLTDRSRRIIHDLMNGERTLDVSQKYGVSPGRVSQMREWFHQSWDKFCADPVAA
jgi:hypothetical protein